METEEDEIEESTEEIYLTRSMRRRWKHRVIEVIGFSGRFRSQITRQTGRLGGNNRSEILHALLHRGLATRQLIKKGHTGFEAEFYRLTDRGQDLLRGEGGHRGKA